MQNRFVIEGDHMFQDTDVFAGVGIGIATGTQPVDEAPRLDPGIHLRWANAPLRGFPSYGHYLLRRPSSAGVSKPVSLNSEAGQTLVESTSSEYDSNRTMGATASGAGTGLSGWVEFSFTDRSYISQVDVLFTAGTTGEVTITAQTDDQVVDKETIDAGTIGRQTVSVTGSYVTTMRIDGDLGLVIDIRLKSQADALARGWEFVPGADQPLSLPLAHNDYPAKSAPANLDEARTLANNRISYGSPGRFTDAETTSSTNGTVSVTAGSPIVEGTNTTWSSNLAGESFQVDQADGAYTVTSVLGSERLVLSRPYAGNSENDASYAICPDRFASIHDSLATLVDGGRTAGGMSARTFPRPILDVGTITRTQDDTTVTGTGTNWSASLEGCALQIETPTTGTVALTHGATTVEGIGTTWTDALEQTQFVVDGQRTQYTVERVTGETELELDRPYDGPTVTASTGGRVYTTFDRTVSTIKQVVDATTLEIAAPHAGPDDSSGRSYRILGGPTDTDATSGGSVRFPAQYPYELLSVGSIDPAMSQLLGQYWVDDTVDTGRSYDYLLVADFTGIVDMLADYWNLDAGDTSDFREFVEDLVIVAEYDLVDAFLLPGLVKEASDPPLPAAPSGVRAYDLPESTAAGTSSDRYAAGLTWDRAHADGQLPVDAPLAYYLWRTNLDTDPGTVAPPDDTYTAVGHEDPSTAFLEAVDPILVVDSAVSEFVPGWPDDPIHTVDGRRPAGWYSYRVNGVDIFGRHTTLSDPAPWYDHETDAKATHAEFPTAPDFAVELRAYLPPPPPAGVTATVLDPQDPAMASDTAANAWWDEHGEQVGLRIEWAWPAEFDAQAPDTDAFECFVQPGSLNSHTGIVTAVNQGPETTRITTTLSHTRDPTDSATAALDSGGFAGAAVHVAGAQFTVVDSGGGSGLWVDVLNREGPEGTITPTVDADCAIAVPAVYSHGTATVVDGDDLVTGTETNWGRALEGQPFRVPTTGETYEVSTVESTTRLRLTRPYEAPPNRDDREATAYAIDHPLSRDYSNHTAWAVHVDDVPTSDDIVDRRTSDGDRFYETTVPAPGADGGTFDPGVGPDELPVVHANIGVCARIDTPDGPLHGNIGGPAPVARVHRNPPAPAAVPPLSSTIDWATRPDYEQTSYYTVRWSKPPDGVKAHVYRAMDQTLFRVDWARRDDNNAHVLQASQTQYFPAELRSEGAAELERREEIATVLTDATLDGTDFDAATAIYASLEPDALQTLAAIPGNEKAFSQRTTEPLAAADAPNVRGPDYEPGDAGPGTQPGDDVPDSMPPGDELCAYVDGFDGRSRNRYLYRVGTADTAHNRSTTLSYPTPPTQARDGVPPETPSIAGIEAGHPVDGKPDDRRLTLRWSAVQSPDLAHYTIYRTDDPAAVRDVRLMDEVIDLPTPIPAPADGDPLTTGTRDGPVLSWTDDDREPGVDFHYRMVAVDTNGNTSAASTAVAGRAFDTTPPTPPAITSVDWVRVGPNDTVQPYSDPVPTDESWQPAIRITWDDPDDLRVLVESAFDTSGSDFMSASSWLTDDTMYLDTSPAQTDTYRYQLRVLDARGLQSTSASPITVGPPGGT